jgi:ATP-dependent Lhr-like helicase
MLLGRYGVVAREAAGAESLPGGFGPIYKVLKAMEEAGRIRRGYFVEGLSAAQFGYAGAIDRLRAARPDEEAEPDADAVRLLPAVDPANPYGALLPWPGPANPEETGPRRVPGAWVVLMDGRLALYAAPKARALITFPGELRDPRPTLELAFATLARLPRAGERRSRIVERVDGIPVHQSEHLAALRAAGLELEPRGLALPTA